jgi:colicin import membrane protein
MVDNRHLKFHRIPAETGQGRSALFLFFVFSFLGHLLVFSGILLLPDLAPAKKYSPSVINVSLVSIPAQGTATRSSSQVTPKAAKQTSSSKASRKSKKIVSVAPAKRKSKKSLKKKTFKSSKVIEQAISKLEKKVEDSRPPALNEALVKLKRQVDETDPSERLRKKAVQSLQAQGIGDGKGTIADRQKTREIIQIYNAEIAYHIRKNWVFSENFAGGRTDLETALGIKVLPSGEITDIWFDKKSGNAHLDDSAQKAVMKSNPLPPLPKEFMQPYYTVGLRFGPKGLK